MKSFTERLIEEGKAVTLQAVSADLRAGNDVALYFAKEDQILKLIDRGVISENYLSYWMGAQDEMSLLMNEARNH